MNNWLRMAGVCKSIPESDNEDVNDYQFSDLPPEVISRIFSFLPQDYVPNADYEVTELGSVIDVSIESE